MTASKKKWKPKKHRHGTLYKPGASRKESTKCPCGGYFSAFDHKYLPDGETCQFLVDARKKSHRWNDRFRARVDRQLDTGLLPDLKAPF